MKTFFMVKPDGVKRNIIGQVINRVEQEGFTISKMKMMNISTELAEEHYGEHKDKPFFNDLVTFMTRGPIIAAALEKDNAVEEFRKLIGSTDPLEALEGTIRKKFAKSKGENAVHGSDSNENAALEIDFHFDENEIFS